MVGIPMTLHVPVKKYLKSFLRSKFGDEYILKSRHPIAMIIYNQTTVKRKKEDMNLPADMIYFDIRMPLTLFNKYKVSTIKKEKVEELNDYFESYFTELMIEFVSGRITMKSKADIIDLLDREEKRSRIQINESIRDFLHKYEVSEEDLSFETALKRFQRGRVQPKSFANKGVTEYLCNQSII